ncbi:hypothetical protein GCM10010365_63820 [Streptomyces poonensis]|uniref:Uncharacterized protein n=1 Tax=Streptomyces poonensis TaxID=68255 RepID=A0A918Q7V4_9ACTN|nr:hypothetical protein GCM10010365_63820 [Streptomyces poonensis]GLJ89264.1 hypothetical protein GCM10017589_18640 [Streptomyces poonensis]
MPQQAVRESNEASNDRELCRSRALPDRKRNVPLDAGEDPGTRPGATVRAATGHRPGGSGPCGRLCRFPCRWVCGGAGRRDGQWCAAVAPPPRYRCEPATDRP